MLEMRLFFLSCFFINCMFAMESDRDLRLLEAAKVGNVIEVEGLLKSGAEAEVSDCLFRSAVDRDERTPLIWASCNGHDEVVRILLAYKANKEAQDRIGYTPLIAASRYGCESIVKILLEAGADIEAKSNTGYTPLIVASYYGHVDVVRVLLAYNANKAARTYRNHEYMTALMCASRHNRIEVVKLLVDNATDVESQCSREKSLFEAVSFNRVEIVKILLDHGVDKDIKGNRNWTPLMYAAANGYNELIKELVKREADIEARSSDGLTSFAIAVANNHSDAVLLLINYGAAITDKMEIEMFFAPLERAFIERNEQELERFKTLLNATSLEDMVESLISKLNNTKPMGSIDTTISERGLGFDSVPVRKNLILMKMLERSLVFFGHMDDHILQSAF